MTGLIAQATTKGPPIDWEALSPFISLVAGACIVRTILTKLGHESLIVSDRGLRHGVFRERFGG